ncbi:hypothetical protein E2P81_ATG02509 [Venturia nashicola]|nr:hypothetical protein E2P81_ATG02509 [Venturia nashicola]
MADQPIAISSSPTRLQSYVLGDHPHLPRNNASIVSRPPVDSWYIRTSAGSDYNCDSLPHVNQGSRNYPQSGTSMSQQQPPAGRISRDDTPVNNDPRSSIRQSPDTNQLRPTPVYASAHHTTPQHASTSNGNGHLYRQNPQVIVPAGPGHQGVGHQQAEIAGLKLVNVPLSPYQAWTKEPMKQTAYSQLPSPIQQRPSPAQQHRPYYAPTHNAPPQPTPQLQHQRPTILTNVSQSFINPDSFNSLNSPQNWLPIPHMPYDPHSAQMYGRPLASPHMSHAVPNGYYRNGSPSLASYHQHHLPHTNGERIQSQLSYSPPPPPPPSSPPQRPDSSRKRVAQSPPTTASRTNTLRRNMYSDHFGQTSVSNHAQRDMAAKKSSQSRSPVPGHAERSTAIGGSSQSRLPVDQMQREKQERYEVERARENFEQEQLAEAERESMRAFQERQEERDRLVEAQIQECKEGGPKSCSALMKDLCFHCIQRQTSRRS